MKHEPQSFPHAIWRFFWENLKCDKTKICFFPHRRVPPRHGLKTKQVTQVFESLAALGTKEVKKNGIFTVPGLCRIKTKTKKATKAGKRMMFGQEVKVKAKPARTVVKAFAVAALKNQI